jgi:hypothetical protein
VVRVEEDIRPAAAYQPPTLIELIALPQTDSHVASLVDEKDLRSILRRRLNRLPAHGATRGVVGGCWLSSLPIFITRTRLSPQRNSIWPSGIVGSTIILMGTSTMLNESFF